MIGYILLSILAIIIAVPLFLFRKKIFKKAPPKKQQLDAIVISGPAGVGKGTLINRLKTNYKGKFGMCCSHTTRDPRPGEVDGVDYTFVSSEKFQDMINKDEFVEYAGVHGRMYGTSKAAVEKVRKTGAVVILEVDVQGAKSIRAATKDKMNVYFIFIRPPTFEALRDRMVKRGTETDDKIKQRLETAKKELDFIETDGRSVYDKILVNDDLDTTYGMLERVLKLYGAFN